MNIHIEIDRNNFVPIYYQIGEQIRQGIEEGKFVDMEKLPPEDTLAAQLSVSRKTIRHTIAKLAKEGYVSRIKGKGTYVNASCQKRKVISIIRDNGASDRNPRCVNDLIGGIAHFTCGMDCEMRMNTYDHIPEIIKRHKAGSGDICGLIFLRHRSCMDKYLKDVNQAGLPYILEGHLNDSENYVDIDNKAPMRQAIEYLTGLGHTKIGMLAFSDRDNYHYEIRRNEIISVLNEFALPINEKWIFEYSTFYYDSTYAETGDFLAGVNDDPPTAFISLGDIASIAFIKRAKELGFGIPEDFSVTGFDDVPEAKFIEPALTTFRQDYFQLGKIAAEKLLELTNDYKNKKQQIKIIPELIIRDSCASPKK